MLRDVSEDCGEQRTTGQVDPLGYLRRAGADVPAAEQDCLPGIVSKTVKKYLIASILYSFKKCLIDTI